MSKKISELPAATTLTNDDELVVNHVDTSGQEPETITSKMTVTNLKGQLGINGKADKVNGATSGDVATLDSNGNLVDSGKTLGKSVPSDAEFTDTQSDWNQTTTTAKDYIKNKPTIPAAQIQSDWNQTNTSAKDYIKNKPTIPSVTGKADKVSGATNGNVATLDANGNLADSGKTLGKSVPADAEFTDTQSDWSQTSTAAKDYIKNKPTLGTASAKDIPASGNASSAQVVMGSDTRLTDSRPASDVSSWAKASTKPSYTASEVGAIATTAKGANGGVAELDSSGKVPSSQLPSFVDDVQEYSSKSAFPATGETGKIYVATDTNKTYRWSGTAYVEISESLALGETSSTAYRGDRGKTAYDHSQTTSGNPHNVTKSDVGLGNVGNFKAVSTAASQGLTATEKANARTNIGAGTSNFSGSYNDLTNKPTIPSAQVNSDWNATSGVAQILNKPTIPDVSGKADKVSSATSGDVATLNASGNLVDSGKTLGKSVPSDAVFTDTKNTAGSTDISSKIYLIGATSQAANPQTYSQDTAYVGTDGCLYSNGKKVLTDHQDISGKLDKTTYEWNKDISFGSSGYLKIGSFPMGDTNLTIEVDSTTSNSYHGTVIIATQNVSTSSMGSAHSVKIYDDPYENIKNKFRVVWTSGSRNYDVYFVPESWSKNLIHIRACNLYGEPSDICMSMSGTAPSSTTGLEPVNALSTKADKVSGATSGNVATLDANGNMVDSNKTLGKSVPSDAVFTDTNTKVTQTNTTGSADYRVLLSENANDTTQTVGARKSANLKFNPSTGNLQATQLNGVTIGSSPKFTDTDTKNTAGSTDSSSKLFLIGATSQAANPQTYSHDTAYVGTDGCLYSGGTKVLTSHQSITGKADKVSGATAGDVATLNASGNLVDSGKTLGKSVPSDAVFTDTKNTAGSTDSSSKLFLIGATSQAANPQTYSQDTAYVGTDGCLYSNSKKVLTDHQDISGKADKVSNATNGNLAALDNNGNLTDSGSKASDFLTAHQTIKQDGITGATVNRFGTCSTGASTAAKTVSITSGTFALETGARVSVKFSNTNTASTPTLNVGSTGAKNIYHKGSKITTGNNKGLLCGTVDFIYDGTQYHIIGADTEGMATDGSNAASEVTFNGTKSFTVGARSSGSTVGNTSMVNGSNNTASGNDSHAEGMGTTASAATSHAEGYFTTASGNDSHAEGYFTTAGYQHQHVSGKYNDNKSTTLFEVGNGTGSSAKSNALEVYSNGDLNITGEYKKNGSVWTPNDPNISDAWASGNLYVVGVYRIYNNTLYKCITEHTSTSSNYPGSSYGYWTAVKVGDELVSLNSGLIEDWTIIYEGYINSETDYTVQSLSNFNKIGIALTWQWYENSILCGALVNFSEVSMALFKRTDRKIGVQSDFSDPGSGTRYAASFFYKNDTKIHSQAAINVSTGSNVKVIVIGIK